MKQTTGDLHLQLIHLRFCAQLDQLEADEGGSIALRDPLLAHMSPGSTFAALPCLTDELKPCGRGGHSAPGICLAATDDPATMVLLPVKDSMKFAPSVELLDKELATTYFAAGVGDSL